MSQLSFEQYYNQILDENLEFLNLSDSIMMEEFEADVRKKYDEIYTVQNKPSVATVVKGGEYFSDLQERFVKGFDIECLMSHIPARIYFFQILSLLFKKQVDENNWDDKEYVIKHGNYYRSFNPLIHFFWQQETSSGKSRGHRYFIRTAKAISRKIAQQNGMKTSNRYTIQTTKWTETQETFINHFQQKQTSKGMQFDFTAPPVPGLFQKADLLASEECAFLFNENRGDKQNISELLLDSLEGNEISKTLVSWNGNETITRPNFVFAGLSRPTKNISKDFFDKGLFQRMIIYTRKTSQLMRTTVIKKSFTSNKNPKSFFDAIADEFYDIYQWKIKNPIKEFTYANPEKIEEMLNDSQEKLFNELNKDYKGNKLVRDGIAPFITRYYTHYIYVLMALAAFSRKSSIIEEQDFKEADYILTKSIESIKLFSEDQIQPDYNLEKKERQIMRNVLQFAFEKKNEPFNRGDLEIFMRQKLKLSLTVITGKVNEFRDIGFLIENTSTQQLHVNKKDYDEFVTDVKDSMKSRSRGGRVR